MNSPANTGGANSSARANRSTTGSAPATTSGSDARSPDGPRNCGCHTRYNRRSANQPRQNERATLRGLRRPDPSNTPFTPRPCWPSHGVVHVRIPCPDCGWAEKRADRTKLAHLDEDGATFTAVCFDHGPYEAHIDPEDDQPYLDLATLYRNLVKERALGRDRETLHVMMKGGDWVFGCQLVDGRWAP